MESVRVAKGGVGSWSCHLKTSPEPIISDPGDPVLTWVVTLVDAEAVPPTHPVVTQTVCSFGRSSFNLLYTGLWQSREVSNISKCVFPHLLQIPKHLEKLPQHSSLFPRRSDLTYLVSLLTARHGSSRHPQPRGTAAGARAPGVLGADAFGRPPQRLATVLGGRVGRLVGSRRISSRGSVVVRPQGSGGVGRVESGRSRRAARSWR